MTELRVGCPMWAHRPWVGRYFPAGTKPGSELGLYAAWCNAVEGNTTFYAEPSPATVAKWVEQAPTDFRFAFKLPRVVTHDKRLTDVATDVRSFLDAIDPLGPRVGPVQVQLPASFGPDQLDVLLAWVPQVVTWLGEGREPYVFVHQPENLDSPGLAAPSTMPSPSRCRISSRCPTPPVRRRCSEPRVAATRPRTRRKPATEL